MGDTSSSLGIIAILLLAIITPTTLTPNIQTWGIPTNCAYLNGTVIDKTVEAEEGETLWVMGSADNETTLRAKIAVSELTYSLSEINNTYSGFTCEMQSIHEMLETGELTILGYA